VSTFLTKQALPSTTAASATSTVTLVLQPSFALAATSVVELHGLTSAPSAFSSAAGCSSLLSGSYASSVLTMTVAVGGLPTGSDCTVTFDVSLAGAATPGVALTLTAGSAAGLSEYIQSENVAPTSNPVQSGQSDSQLSCWLPFCCGVLFCFDQRTHDACLVPVLQWRRGRRPRLPRPQLCPLLP
jgi:hypothetical protein